MTLNLAQWLCVVPTVAGVKRTHRSSRPQPNYATKCSLKQAATLQLKVEESLCACVLWGHLCHAYKMASSLNRHRGVKAITALAIQHNGLFSPHHQSLSQPHPSHTHTQTQDNNTRIQIFTHTCTSKCTSAHTHTLSKPHAVRQEFNYATNLEWQWRI